MNSWVATSLEETQALAAGLARHLRAGDVVVLGGSLGAGKTHFVQGVAAALGIAQPVTSPTFSILQTYCGGSLPVNHFDLYRLEDEGELEDIGFWEALEGNAASFVEWGDKFPQCLPDDYLEVSVIAAEDGTRTFHVESHGPRSGELLSRWAATPK